MFLASVLFSYEKNSAAVTPELFRWSGKLPADNLTTGGINPKKSYSSSGPAAGQVAGKLPTKTLFCGLKLHLCNVCEQIFLTCVSRYFFGVGGLWVIHRRVISQ